MLRRLRLRRFRNLEAFEWEPTDGPQVVLGPNGVGKTTLLEAVYLLATTRSFRTARLAECRRRGDDGFVIRGELGDPPRRLEVVWHAGETRRTCDDQRISTAEWLRIQPVSLWTSADLEILLGAPKARRRFLDRGIVGTRPTSLDVLGRYRRALREKRELLSRGQPGIEAWNDVLAPPAAELTRRRAAYVEALVVEVRRFLGDCGLGADWVGLEYRPSLDGAEVGDEAVREELEGISRRERAAEMPLKGPHRDRLTIRWRGGRVASAASAGERKLTGLVLAAAHAALLARREPPPILLLDDLDAELDHERLAAVWKGLAALGQVLATSNRGEMFEGAGAPAPARTRTLGRDGAWVADPPGVRPRTDEPSERPIPRRE